MAISKVAGLTEAHVRSLLFAKHGSIRYSQPYLDMGVEAPDAECWGEARLAGLVVWDSGTDRPVVTQRGDDALEEAGRIAAGLTEYEVDVLRSVVAGPRKQWGGAVGQAYECLRSSGCLTEEFEAKPAGRLVLALRDRVL